MFDYGCDLRSSTERALIIPTDPRPPHFVVQTGASRDDMLKMGKRWIPILIALTLVGCDRQLARMEHPDDPQGPYAEQIAAANRLLQQKEDWADRAEWEVIPSVDGWKVIAWRVEHPDRKGPDRYLPWGYSVIELDRRNVAIDYHRKG
jgi:hypothetical protein